MDRITAWSLVRGAVHVRIDGLIRPSPPAHRTDPKAKLIRHDDH
jgi:hypothetical protein